MKEFSTLCPLCGRVLGTLTSDHHLIPRSQKHKIKTKVTRPITVKLHLVCHNMIHQLFCVKELAKNLNTIEKLKKHKKIKEFVNNIKDKPIDFYYKMKKIKEG